MPVSSRRSYLRNARICSRIRRDPILKRNVTIATNSGAAINVLELVMAFFKLQGRPELFGPFQYRFSPCFLKVAGNFHETNHQSRLKVDQLCNLQEVRMILNLPIINQLFTISQQTVCPIVLLDKFSVIVLLIVFRLAFIASKGINFFALKLFKVLLITLYLSKFTKAFWIDLNKAIFSNTISSPRK